MAPIEARATADEVSRRSSGEQVSPNSSQRSDGRSARSRCRCSRQEPQRARTQAPLVSASRTSRVIRGESPYTVWVWPSAVVATKTRPATRAVNSAGRLSAYSMIVMPPRE